MPDLAIAEQSSCQPSRLGDDITRARFCLNRWGDVLLSANQLSALAREAGV
jgi:hypothetical protein